jgi:chromosome segregation ATPase
MGELDDIRRRVGAIEADVAALTERQEEMRGAITILGMVDRDVSDLKLEVRAQRQVLQALRDNQIGQDRVLREHSRALGELLMTMHAMHESQNAQAQTLAEHTAILREHTTVLGEHSAILREHTTVLGEHSTVLGQHSRTLAEHSHTLGEHTGLLNEILEAVRAQGTAPPRADPGQD